jgi:hypothetical protein
MVCEHKYMNIRPPHPNYRAGGATDDHQESVMFWA